LNVVLVSLALDLGKKICAIHLEEWMAELDLIEAPLDLVEVIHIELADERVQVVMFEVER